jgi:hypothetical protein
MRTTGAGNSGLPQGLPQNLVQLALVRELAGLNAAESQQRRGSGNAISDFFMDIFSRRGQHLEAAVGRANADLLAPGALTAAGTQRLAKDVNDAYAEETGYVHLKDKVAGVVSSATATTAVIGMGMLTGPAVFPGLIGNAALAGGASALAGVGTKKVLEGKEYTRSQMLQDSALNWISGTAASTVGSLGLGAKLIWGKLGGTLLGRAAQGAVNGGASGLTGGVVGAGINPANWRSGSMNGVLNLAERGVLGLTTGAVTGGGLNAVVAGETFLKSPDPSGESSIATAQPGTFLQVMSSTVNHQLKEDPAFEKLATDERSRLRREMLKIQADVQGREPSPPSPVKALHSVVQTVESWAGGQSP